MVRSDNMFVCFKVPKRVKSNSVVPTDGQVSTIDINYYRPAMDMMSSTNELVSSDMASRSTLNIDTAPDGSAEDPIKMQSRHSFLWHLFIDLPIVIMVAVLCVLLEFGILPSRRAGFLCGDPNLAYKHVGDTFSISNVALITVAVPFLFMWIVESILHQEDEYSIKQNKLCTSAKAAGIIYRDYTYGSIILFMIMEIVKCVVGAPRPTFFELCKPDTLETACNATNGIPTYVDNYRCTSKYSQYLQIDSSRSFPSAHAGLSVYCGLFLAWYLQRRAFSWHNRSVFLVPLVQTTSLAFAAVCSLSRVADRRHHWWDVLAGAVAGAFAVCYTVLVLQKNFSQPAVASTSDLSSSDSNNHQSVRRLIPSGCTRVDVS